MEPVGKKATNLSNLKSKNEFISSLKSRYPDLASASLEDLISENLLSPFVIQLPADILKQAQDFVRNTFQLRETKAYQEKYSEQLNKLGLKDPGNKSIAMSYDFHVNSENQLKLIEVNTNASFLALGFEMYTAAGVELPIKDFHIEEVDQNIQAELKLQGKNIASPSIAIIDEEPEKQRLYAEFLLYQSLFIKWGYKSQIVDYRNLLSKVDFIYNRWTDFYLNQESSKDLRKSFLDRSVCISPNPYEYFLLADKNRMLDWQNEPSLKPNLPGAEILTKENAEQIWSKRKNLFFKPMQSFGSKQTFKGASISRRAFDEICNQGFLAQEFIPAPELEFTTPEGKTDKFKYDLRFYAYQDRVQLAVARIYQGQVTNLKTPWGGFACVQFI